MPEEDFGGLLGFGAGSSGGEQQQGQPILGTNDLLKAAKDISDSVSKLTAVYSQVSNPHTLGTSSGNNGPGGLPGQSSQPSPNGGGGGFSSWMQSAFVANTPYTSASSPLSSSRPAGGATGQTAGGETPGAGFSGTIGQSMGGGGYQQQQQAANGGGPPGGGGSVTMGGASIPLPSSSTSSGKMLGGAAAVVSAAFSAGQQQLPGQLALSNLSQQAGLMGTSQGQARYGAVGKGNGGLNTQSLNVGDAASGQSILMQLSGTSNTRGRGAGSQELRNAMGGANLISYSNPGLGYAKSAQAVSNLYSPQGAASLMSAGVGADALPLNPRNPNQTRGLPTVLQGIMQRISGKTRMSPQALAHSLKTGNIMDVDLQQMLGPQNAQAIIPAMEAENKVAYQGNMSASQVSSLFNRAARPKNDKQGQAARSELQKRFGINDTAIQHITQAQSVKSGRQNEIYGPFQKGLADATGALTKFNEKINSLLNGPLGKSVGYAQGFGGTLEKMSSPGNLLSGLGGGLGMGMAAKGVTGMLGKMFGGKAAETEIGKTLGKVLGKTGLGKILGKSGGAKGAGAAAGEEGAAAEGSAGAMSGVAGPLGGGLAAGAIGQGLWDSLTKKLGKKKGVLGLLGKGASGLTDFLNPFDNNSGHSVFSDVGKGISSIGGLFGGDAKKNQKGKKNPSKKKAKVSGGGGSSSPTNSGNKSGGAGPSGQAQKAVSAAETQEGVPYVWGGTTPGKGFDCSGLTSWAYHQAGVSIPRTSGQQYQFLKQKNRIVDLKNVEEGDLVFSNGTDGGTNSNPGHVGMMTSQNKLIQAPHTGADIDEITFDASDWTHAGRPTGSTKGSGTGSGSGSGSANNNTTTSNGGGGPGGLGLQLGAYGSANEADVIGSGLQEEAGGGGTSSTTTQNNGGGGGGGDGTGGNVSGGSNGAKLYNYLLDNVFSHHKIAAAGALASIWGESKWNPESAGTGGNGLLGWTPARPGIVTGNPAKDMAKQLPMIKTFIQQNNDEQYVKQMLGAKSVADAANIWGPKIERFGVNDVHSAGIAAAKKIAGLAMGSEGADPGWTWVGERGPELVKMKGGEPVVRAAEAAAAVGVAEVPTNLSPQGKSLMGSPSKGGVSVKVEKGGMVINNVGGWGNKTPRQAMEETLKYVCEHFDEGDVDLSVMRGEKHS